VSGISTTQFVIPASAASVIQVGLPVQIHDQYYSHYSPVSGVSVQSVSGNVVTLASPLTFTPTAGMFAELVGFPNNGQPYRIL
jgi:hypothetical protein